MTHEGTQNDPTPSSRPTADVDATVTLDRAGLQAEVGLSEGALIGAYRLREIIGVGGFGVVWLAEQKEPIRRRVALKVIKPGMDSAAVVARFEAERNALSVMDHPNIARVLDGGTTERGLPYFVLEYVPGEPITDYCRRKKLSLNRRLEVFAQVCQAVQHAHAKGVIHRDLKPSNILVREVDDKPMAKVIDFGVAKALDQRLTEQTIFTARGHVVGTPEYMAPEQAEGSGRDIDTRADVYSLGVTLYELLAGRRPFDLTEISWRELSRVLSEVDPPRPSTRLLETIESRPDSASKGEVRSTVRALRSDLDWVVMKCLEKDRSRRYQTAAALGDDVERYLRGEMILAGPPSVRYRVGKFARKHRSSLVIGSVIGLALLVAILSLIVSQQRVIDAGEVLAAEQQETILARDALVESQEEAIAAAQREANLLDFVRAEIVDSARPSDLGSGVTVIDAVARSLTRIAGYDIGGEPAAELFAQFARVLYRAGRDTEAAAFAEDAAGFYNDAGILEGQALVNRMTLANALRRLARFEEAELVFEPLERDVVEVLGQDHSFALSVRNSRALNIAGTGDFAQAKKVFDELRERRTASLGAAHPRTLPVAISAIDADSVLNEFLGGSTQGARERFDDARSVLADAMRLGDRGEVGVAAAAIVVRTAADLAESGDLSEVPGAEQLAAEWLAIARDRLSDESDLIATIKQSRGRMRLATGDTAAGLADLRASAELFRERSIVGVVDRREVVARCRVLQALKDRRGSAEYEDARALLVALRPLASLGQSDPARGFVEQMLAP